MSGGFFIVYIIIDISRFMSIESVQNIADYVL